MLQFLISLIIGCSFINDLDRETPPPPPPPPPSPSPPPPDTQLFDIVKIQTFNQTDNHIEVVVLLRMNVYISLPWVEFLKIPNRFDLMKTFERYNNLQLEENKVILGIKLQQYRILRETSNAKFVKFSGESNPIWIPEDVLKREFVLD